MEARVDIRKLQLLNDRITQTIDALNQVRWSVHGLQHTGGGQQNQGGYGATQQTLPFQTQSPYGQVAYGQQQPFGIPQQGFNPWQQQSQPFAQQAFGQQQPLSSSQIPYAQSVVGSMGMQHSTATPYGIPAVGFGFQQLDVDQRLMEARANDPYQLARTFPQVFGPIMGW